MTEQRFIDLEMKLTHQEFLLEQLSQALYKQQVKIEELEAKLTGIGKRFQEGATGAGEIRGNEKPPHY